MIKYVEITTSQATLTNKQTNKQEED